MILKQQPAPVHFIYTPNELAIVVAEGAKASKLPYAGGRQQQRKQQRVKHLLADSVRVGHARRVKLCRHPSNSSRAP